MKGDKSCPRCGGRGWWAPQFSDGVGRVRCDRRPATPPASPPPADEGTARRALREVEWSYRGVGGEGTEPEVCPACYRTKREGHDGSCEVGSALASPAPRDDKFEAAFRTLMAESEGVAGLHRNGEVADWEWLLDHDWIPPLSSPASDTKENRNG